MYFQVLFVCDLCTLVSPLWVLFEYIWIIFLSKKASYELSQNLPEITCKIFFCVLPLPTFQPGLLLSLCSDVCVCETIVVTCELSIF